MTSQFTPSCVTSTASTLTSKAGSSWQTCTRHLTTMLPFFMMVNTDEPARYEYLQSLLQVRNTEPHSTSFKWQKLPTMTSDLALSIKMLLLGVNIPNEADYLKVLALTLDDLHPLVLGEISVGNASEAGGLTVVGSLVPRATRRTWGSWFTPDVCARS